MIYNKDMEKEMVINMERALNQYSKKILNSLVDKYESSKTFIEDNKVNQSFRVNIGDLFPKYKNDADYDTFFEVNESISNLLTRNYIRVEQKRNDVVEQVVLNVSQLREIYAVLERKSKRDELGKLKEVLNIYINLDNPIGYYSRAQINKIQTNRKVEYYSGDLEELKSILKAASAVLANQQEIFVRDMSIHIFGESKKLELLKVKVQGLLFQYGEFEEKEFVLEECGVVNTPTYVMVKGNGILYFQAQMINLSSLGADIGISTKTIEHLKAVEVNGQRIVTIENLTTFHDYPLNDDFVIYLGGFHNKVKTILLKMIYENNTNKRYLHFGDIDVGGFYIFQNLCHKTQIPFATIFMDIRTLEKYRNLWIPLTDNDNRRLDKIKEYLKLGVDEIVSEQCKSTLEVLEYMSKNQCKLEQEGIKCCE